MANVQARYSATITDAWGIKSSAAAYATITDTYSLAAVLDDAHYWGYLLDHVTDGVISNVRVTLLTPPAIDYKATPAAGARIEQTGTLNFQATGSHKRYGFTIPALAAGALAGDRIDLTGVAPAALLATELTLTGSTAVYCNDHYQPLTALTDAFIGTRKKRKQLQRSSFEV